jgi:hypothetical protein
MFSKRLDLRITISLRKRSNRCAILGTDVFEKKSFKDVDERVEASNYSATRFAKEEKTPV